MAYVGHRYLGLFDSSVDAAVVAFRARQEHRYRFTEPVDLDELADFLGSIPSSRRVVMAEEPVRQSVASVRPTVLAGSSGLRRTAPGHAADESSLRARIRDDRRMTQVAERATTGDIRIRVRYLQVEDYALGNLITATAALVPLLMVLLLDERTVSLLNERFVYRASSEEAGSLLETSVPILLGSLQLDVQRLRVESVDKHSPMEIVLVISSSSTLAYGVLDQWYRLRERRSKQKVRDAEARLATSAINLMYEHIRRLGAREDLIENGTEVGNLLRRSGEALRLIDGITNLSDSSDAGPTPPAEG